MERNRQLFMEWLQKNSPDLYADALIDATDKTGMSGLGADTSSVQGSRGSWFNNFATSITKLGSKYLDLKSQRKLMSVQLRRARLGQPPLPTPLPPGVPGKKYGGLDATTIMPLAMGAGVLLIGFLLLRNK